MPSDLVLANRLLADRGVVDSFGHVSMRHPDRPDRYLLSRSRAPYLVVDADIMEFTLENEPVSHDERALYAGRAIHARIYAARPDVAAICHKHAPATIPFGVTGTDLRPIFHMAWAIGASIPIWDIADRFGDTNVLVTKNEMGDHLAHMLGSHRVARMRVHGSVVTGATLREDVFTAVYRQANAESLTAAIGLGPVRSLNDGEIDATSRTLFEPLSHNRAWENWAAQIALDAEKRRCGRYRDVRRRN